MANFLDEFFLGELNLNKDVRRLSRIRWNLLCWGPDISWSFIWQWRRALFLLLGLCRETSWRKSFYWLPFCHCSRIPNQTRSNDTLYLAMSSQIVPMIHLFRRLSQWPCFNNMNYEFFIEDLIHDVSRIDLSKLDLVESCFAIVGCLDVHSFLLLIKWLFNYLLFFNFSIGFTFISVLGFKFDVLIRFLIKINGFFELLLVNFILIFNRLEKFENTR